MLGAPAGLVNRAARRFLPGGPGGNGAEGRTRTGTGCPTRPSNVRVYQFRHFGKKNVQAASGPLRISGLPILAGPVHPVSPL
jgi:hypothetical protein